MMLHMAGIGLQRSPLKTPSGVPEFSFGSSTVEVRSKRTKSVQSRQYLASGLRGEKRIYASWSFISNSLVAGSAN